MAFERTTTNLPGIRGIALPKEIGEAAALILTALFVLVAFQLRGGRSLAALGQGSVASSPTLYLHGRSLALPGFLSLRAGFFWLALLVPTTTGLDQLLWLVLVGCLAAAFVPALRDTPESADARWQPLGSGEEPWRAGRGSGAGRSRRPT
jgi:hypothetical protein